MGVDHRRLDVPVTQQLLDGSDVIPVGLHVGSEAVPEAVQGGGLGEAGLANGSFERWLDGSLVPMAEPFPLRCAVPPAGAGREEVLPAHSLLAPGSLRASA